MHTKPFSLQSPEQIAKDYGGNKQKIAHAAQMGLVDSTAAVLAGMFIDRMRSAQTLEQQPPQTVAQQVLSPQPPAPPPPGPPQGGPPTGMAGAPPIGGLQQRLGMATQQGGTPVPPPQPAGPGFAEGGLASLSVPDGMFDEPSNGGFNDGGLAPSYAGGGIVAFADGGEVYRMGDGYVYSDGSPAPAPAPGSTVQRGAQRLIGSGIVGSGRGYTVPVAPIAPPYTKPDKPEGYVPFGSSSTGIGRAVKGVREAYARASDEATQSAALQADYDAGMEAYLSAVRHNRRVAAVGGGVPVPVPPKPTPPKKPSPAAKPAAVKPSSSIAAPAPRAGSPTPVSMSQLQAALTGGITPRPASGGAPATPPAPRVGGTPSAAPRGGVPSAPRVGSGVAPAGPALSASPPAATGAVQPPPPTGAAAVLAELQALAPQDHTMRDVMAKRYADMSSPEALAAQKKQDFWGSLAQIGFGMAGSNSPHFLQAVGQSASAALPGMQQATQARKAQEMAALQGQLGIENVTNQERQALAARAAELSEQRRKGEIDQRQFDEQMALKREELAIDREYKRAMAGAAGTRASRSGGGRAKTTGGKPLTRAQALALVNGDRKSLRMTPEQKLARADALIASSSGGGAAPAAGPVRVFDPNTGTFK